MLLSVYTFLSLSIWISESNWAQTIQEIECGSAWLNPILRLTGESLITSQVESSKVLVGERIKA